MKKLSILFLTAIFATACSERIAREESEEDTKNEVLQAYNEMYTSYGEGTDEFFKYFEDDFLRITPSGESQTGVEERKKEWNTFLETYALGLENFGKPEMIVSAKQVVTIGGYNEYFINRETQDSSYNRGVYIATWRKQEDGAWKICMDTWHSGLDRE